MIDLETRIERKFKIAQDCLMYLKEKKSNDSHGTKL